MELKHMAAESQKSAKVVDFVRPQSKDDLGEQEAINLILGSIGVIVCTYFGPLPPGFSSGKIFLIDKKPCALMIYDYVRDYYVVRLKGEAFRTLVNSSNVLVVDKFNFKELDEVLD